MKKGTHFSARKICVIAGVCLLTVATLTLVVWRWNLHSAQKQAENYVQILQSLIPEPREALPEPRRDNTMSVLSVEGSDFVGMIEMPRYGCVLPVGGAWGKCSQFPCRFSGSIYDGTMQIGATSQTGQFDFYRELSLGETMIFTDAEGNRYTYKITALRNEKHADQEALQRVDAPLTLFIKNIYSFEYLIVFCDIQY